VKHVTVNADQALVTDSVVTGTSVGRTALASPTSEPMAILETAQSVVEPVAWGEVSNRNEHQPHAKRPRRSSLQSQIKAHGSALPIASGKRLSRLPHAWGRRRCA
jgi:hypothetical protein